MGQVGNLGTGGTFMPDAKRYGLDGNDIAQNVRTWFARQDKSPQSGKYKHTQGQSSYLVDYQYNSASLSLTCTKITKA